MWISFFAGVQSVAFFFSAIGTQGPKKAAKKNKKNLEDNGEESDSEHFTVQLNGQVLRAKAGFLATQLW